MQRRLWLGPNMDNASDSLAAATPPSPHRGDPAETHTPILNPLADPPVTTPYPVVKSNDRGGFVRAGRYDTTNGG